MSSIHFTSYACDVYSGRFEGLREYSSLFCHIRKHKRLYVLTYECSKMHQYSYIQCHFYNLRNATAYIFPWVILTIPPTDCTSHNYTPIKFASFENLKKFALKHSNIAL